MRIPGRLVWLDETLAQGRVILRLIEKTADGLGSLWRMEGERECDRRDACPTER